MGVGPIDNASVNIASLICYCVYVKRKKRYDNYRHIYSLERGRFEKFNFIYKSEMNKKYLRSCLNMYLAPMPGIIRVIRE